MGTRVASSITDVSVAVNKGKNRVSGFGPRKHLVHILLGLDVTCLFVVIFQNFSKL